MASVQYDGRPSPGALPVWHPSHAPDTDAATQLAMGWLDAVVDRDETSPPPPSPLGMPQGVGIGKGGYGMGKGGGKGARSPSSSAGSVCDDPCEDGDWDLHVSDGDLLLSGEDTDGEQGADVCGCSTPGSTAATGPVQYSTSGGWGKGNRHVPPGTGKMVTTGGDASSEEEEDQDREEEQCVEGGEQLDLPNITANDVDDMLEQLDDQRAVNTKQLGMNSVVLSQLHKMQSGMQKLHKQVAELQSQNDALRADRDTASSSSPATAAALVVPPPVGAPNPRAMTEAEADELATMLQQRWEAWQGQRTPMAQVCKLMRLNPRLHRQFNNKLLYVPVHELGAERMWDLWHLLRGEPYDHVMPKARWTKLGKELQVDAELTSKTCSVPDACGGRRPLPVGRAPPDGSKSAVIATVTPLLPSVSASARSAPLRSPKSPVQKVAHGRSSGRNKPGKQRKCRANTSAQRSASAPQLQLQQLQGGDDVLSPTLLRPDLTCPAPSVSFDASPIPTPTPTIAECALTCPHPLMCNAVETAVEDLLNHGRMDRIYAAAAARLDVL